MVLPSAESLEMVYTTIITRFPIIPKVIVYDNACNLSEYCLNRNPNLFKDSVFLVDAFHYKSHTNCSHSYDSANSLCMAGLSSGLHEQKNRYLAKNKINCIFMGVITFMYYFKGLLALMNYKELNQ